ncbi:Phytanoyl-CoA dioxygenase [Pararobbsia alpina]|uniref:phytanoyl-CoA dioxygenase family protein n=1 Tax=Pararobbsia alpina TaxID=621374 RepID=UPI0039A78259
MKHGSLNPQPAHAVWYSDADCKLDDFVAALAPGDAEQRLHYAASVERGVPVYDCPALRGTLRVASERAALLAEWVDVMLHGAGVLVLRAAYEDTAVIDAATAIFESIVVQERESGASGADHFAKAGANDRIWNALEKLCMLEPDVFARYYANPFIAAISEAWLGPHYQMTSQINVVRPGGAAQQAHRDYHLGFQTNEEALRYPAHVHTMSPLLTLQGAVAHGDMPVESGPTKLLPFSQRYAPGYLAWRRPEFRAHFEAHCVQLPLQKGDAVFFNPALFHAAGDNRTADISRMANLLQVSSAYGRAMETVDRTRMSIALYPVLRTLRASGALDVDEVGAAIASCAEGYPFPTNLDTDPPVGGLAPESQQQLMRRAIDEAWSEMAFCDAVRAQQRKRQSI